MEQRFIVVTEQEARFSALSEAIKSLGVSVWLHWNSDVLVQLVGSMGANVVFVEFTEERLGQASELATKLLSVYPRLWIVGFAQRADSSLIIESMRAGARDFVELQASSEVICRSLKQVLEQSPKLPAQSSGRMISLLGARPGVGTSMAAVHLALLLKQEVMPDQPVLLLDFGYPTADAALYLDTKVNFNFCDAVRSLRRFDHALLNTAFAHHKSGLALLSLPQNLAELRDISPVDAMTLLSLLKSYFKVVVVDLGGFAGTDLLLYALGVSDSTLLISEQSIPSVFSARQLLANFRERGVDTERIGLLTGKFDSRIEMSSSQLAQHLQLHWVGDLPQRTERMIACANQGRLLLDVSPGDPYVAVLREMAFRESGMERREGGSSSHSSGRWAKLRAWFGA
jgi:pilus assembly protein CpaE